MASIDFLHRICILNMDTLENRMIQKTPYCEESTRTWPPLMHAEAELCGLGMDCELTGMVLMMSVLTMNIET